MKFLLLSIQLLLFNLCFAQSNNYNIKAEIDGIGNDSVYVIYYPLSNMAAQQKDTIVAKENIFTYKLPIKEPAAVAIIPQKSFYKRLRGGLYLPQTKFIELIILPNDKINIIGKVHQYYLDYVLTGSKINETHSKIRLAYKIHDIETVKIELQIDSLYGKEIKKDEIESLFKLRDAKFAEIRKPKLQFIKENTNHDLSAYYLSSLPIDSFSLYYPRLTSSVRNGIFSEVLNYMYSRYQKLKATDKAGLNIIEGNQAPDFSLKDSNGKTVSLSHFKGNYIVLDFWGSWCGWCIKDFPRLKNYFDKHKSEIKFVGIACNDNPDAWKEAIKKYQLNWTQLINDDDKDVSVLYGVKAFPTKVILDKDLKIIKLFVGSNEDFYRTLNELLDL